MYWFNSISVNSLVLCLFFTTACHPYTIDQHPLPDLTAFFDSQHSTLQREIHHGSLLGGNEKEYVQGLKYGLTYIETFYRSFDSLQSYPHAWKKYQNFTHESWENGDMIFTINKLIFEDTSLEWAGSLVLMEISTQQGEQNGYLLTTEGFPLRQVSINGENLNASYEAIPILYEDARDRLFEIKGKLGLE